MKKPPPKPAKLPKLPTAMHLEDLRELVTKPPDQRTCPAWLKALCVFFGCCPQPPPAVPGPNVLRVSVR